MILNLYGITFHPAVVLGPEHYFFLNLPQHTVILLSSYYNYSTYKCYRPEQEAHRYLGHFKQV